MLLHTCGSAATGFGAGSSHMTCCPCFRRREPLVCTKPSTVTQPCLTAAAAFARLSTAIDSARKVSRRSACNSIVYRPVSNWQCCRCAVPPVPQPVTLSGESTSSSIEALVRVAVPDPPSWQDALRQADRACNLHARLGLVKVGRPCRNGLHQHLRQSSMLPLQIQLSALARMLYRTLARSHCSAEWSCPQRSTAGSGWPTISSALRRANSLQ